MVWGLILEPKKQYSQRVLAPYKITGAALDITHADDRPVKVMLNFNGTTVLLCTLQRNMIQQAPLNIKIKKKCVIKFFIVGKSPVHLVGNFLQEEGKREEIYYLDQISSHKPRHSIRDPLKKSQQTHQPKDFRSYISTDEDEDEFIKEHKAVLDKIINRLTHRRK